MTKTPTNVIFLWHMHQPYYQHPDKEYYNLPWVRLHGTKDYYGMAKMIEKFDRVTVTFNFSGILLKQLLDYAQNGAKDYYVLLTLKNPSYLKREEKEFIIERFFSVNFERFIRPQKRYLQLHNKKLAGRKNFTVQEISDLQALFNLCWFHPYTVKEDKHLQELIRKEKHYTQDDKEYIIQKHYEILSSILPLYNRLLSQRKIEVTVTPYHHPIMPLLYDTDVLNNFSYLKKPPRRFSSPGDCKWHLEEAKEIFKEVFDESPSGSWPSEGSVSEETLSVYAEQHFKWVATDEAILFKSLMTDYVTYDMIEKQRHLIYRFYKFRGVNVFFRDRNLSDAISFIYQGWEDPVFAANDLLEHFKRIHYYIRDLFKHNVIGIIMDGENAWEYYKNNGVSFLETVYAALEKSDLLSITTPSRFLKHHQSKNLERLGCGSWINGDFGVWIGSKKNNEYWYILNKIKAAIDKSKVSRQKLDEARHYFRLIEGSDWFWWNTFEDPSGEFKKIFFSYVEKIFSLLGRHIPAYIKK